jgi:outer membrane protein, heavy metal efflux system
MRRNSRGLFIWLLLIVALGQISLAQKALTWQEVRDKFEAANPTLRAGQIGIDDSRAQEITANLRPNPNLTILADQIDPFNGGPSHGPFAYLLSSGSVSQLWDSQHKRGLRLESAQKATALTVSGQSDLERNLLFNLRGAFIQTLQEKAILNFAKENLAYYDHVLDVNRERYKAGGIAQVDLKRLELQRVQYLSDLQTADVNLRTAKIQLLMLLNDQTPVEQFEVIGAFDFAEQTPPLNDVRQAALDTRPDLRAALQSVDKAKTDYKLSIATSVRDTISFSYQHGAASLLDFLNAQADYRSVQVNYLNLVASYLNAASQLNLSVGREVIQ